MDFDFGAFFSDAGKNAQAAIDDALKVGVPAVKSSLEQWGIDTLRRMNGETQAELNQAVKELTANDPAPGSLGAAFATTIKGTILEQYGTEIIVGVVLLIGLGLFLRGK